MAHLKVRRPAEKKFFQARWNGSAWVDGAPEGPKIPYRLPELLTAKPHFTVVISEGEKDVDNLVAVGFVASTNAGGATNWSADLNQYFKGRDIVILPHNDEKGEKHAAKVVENLALASSLRILR